jgi:hypothetical protein
MNNIEVLREYVENLRSLQCSKMADTLAQQIEDMITEYREFNEEEEDVQH